MRELIAALAAFAAPFQQAVHGADGAMKLALIEQRRIDLRGRRVLKTILMKARKNGLLFSFCQSPRREPQYARWPGTKTADTPPILMAPVTATAMTLPPRGVMLAPSFGHVV